MTCIIIASSNQLLVMPSFLEYYTIGSFRILFSLQTLTRKTCLPEINTKNFYLIW